MSREIKFRAWNIKQKLMAKVSSLHSSMKIHVSYKKGKEKNGHFFGGNWVGADWNKEESIIMQFTGLKDKNGVDIYEGDEIKFHTGMKNRDSINTKICFNQGCFGFRSLDHDGVKVISSFIPFSSIQSSLQNNNIWLDDEEILEVVGNIHENKD